MRNTYFEGVSLIDRQGNVFAAIRDTLNGWVFGPTFDNRVDVDQFLDWLWAEYNVEPDSLDGWHLRRAFDAFYNRVINVPQSVLDMNCCVIVAGDTPCTRQVAVVKQHYSKSLADIQTIYLDDPVGIQYLCRDAQTDNVLLKPAQSNVGTGSEGPVFIVPAGACIPVTAFGALLSVRGGALECDKVAERLDGVPAAWQYRGFGNGPWCAEMLVSDWVNLVVPVAKPVSFADIQKNCEDWMVGASVRPVNEAVKMDTEAVSDAQDADSDSNESLLKVLEQYVNPVSETENRVKRDALSFLSSSVRGSANPVSKVACLINELLNPLEVPANPVVDSTPLDPQGE